MNLTPGHHPDCPIDQVHVSDRNPRRISDESFERLKYTLTNRPDLMEARPLIALPDGEVIGGNMRLKAALALGWTQIPVYVTEHVSDAERREAVTLDNQPFGEWIPDELAMLVAEHERDGGDMALLGFSDTEASDLLKLAAGDDQGDGRDAPSDDPLVNVPERAKPLEIWQLGRHTIMVGDALASDHYEQLLAHAEVTGIDLAVTSPPYNQRLESFKPSGMMKEGANPAYIKRLAGAYEDSLPEPEYQSQQVAMLLLVAQHMKPTGAMFYNHKIRYRDKRIVHPLDWLRSAADEWAVRQEIIWHRRTSITQNARMFMPTDERIYWLTHGDDFLFNDTVEHKSWSSVWEGVGQGGEYKVSAPFPVELPSRAIRACSAEGDVVLDPYMGTGTTLMAAEHLSRRAIGLELNPRHADVVIHRWEAYTGETAVAVSAP